MSSPNTNYIANKNIRRRSTYQFIKECNELSISPSSSRPPLSPDFIASVYHQLHTIDNAHEHGSIHNEKRCPVYQQPSTSKVLRNLDGSDSDFGVVDSSTSLMNKNGGAQLSPLVSNAPETVDHHVCPDPQSEPTQDRSKSDDPRKMASSCSQRINNDHICTIEHGGFNEPDNNGFEACDESLIDDNKVIQLFDVSLFHIHFHHT